MFSGRKERGQIHCADHGDALTLCLTVIASRSEPPYVFVRIISVGCFRVFYQLYTRDFEAPTKLAHAAQKGEHGGDRSTTTPLRPVSLVLGVIPI